MRGIEKDGVGRGYHGGDGASGVALIACLLAVANIVQRDTGPALQEFMMPPPRTFRWIGRQEELTLGLGKDNRALIATLADNVSPLRQLALEFREMGSHRGTVGDRFRCLGHFWPADRSADILAVQDDLPARHAQLGSLQQHRQRRFARTVDTLFQRLQRDRPIHGAGIEELEAEPRRQVSRRRALTRTCRAIDGDDHTNLKKTGTGPSKSRPRFLMNKYRAIPLLSAGRLPCSGLAPVTP